MFTRSKNTVQETETPRSGGVGKKCVKKKQKQLALGIVKLLSSLLSIAIDLNGGRRESKKKRNEMKRERASKRVREGNYNLTNICIVR